MSPGSGRWGVVIPLESSGGGVIGAGVRGALGAVDAGSRAAAAEDRLRAAGALAGGQLTAGLVEGVLGLAGGAVDAAQLQPGGVAGLGPVCFLAGPGGALGLVRPAGLGADDLAPPPYTMQSSMPGGRGRSVAAFGR
jgi:hypothetical protein